MKIQLSYGDDPIRISRKAVGINGNIIVLGIRAIVRDNNVVKFIGKGKKEKVRLILRKNEDLHIDIEFGEYRIIKL